MGVVYLVGAGPGDPGLLTRRGAGLLRRADVVVHDALVDARLLQLARRDARIVDVGKRCGGRRTEQSRIHEVLVEAARSADVVVRLKGGDPFVFGRGGEEALALRAAGVPFVVVPGVTAGLGATAYAGIPATHRGLASAVTFVSGHAPENVEEEDGRWRELARLGGTIVVYMAVARLERIAARLLQGGLPEATPAAVVEWGTCAHQRTVSAPLSRIAERAVQAGLGAPAVLVVGDVVSLRQHISWFDDGPLAGRRVLLARARAQRSRLAARLRAAGAEVIEHPRLRDRHIRSVSVPLGPDAGWDWIALSSVGAVAWLLAELRRQGLDLRALRGTRLAALGGATVAALRRRGLEPELATSTYVAEEVLAGFGTVTGQRVLWPRARGAGSPLARALVARGARVRELEPFEVVPAEEGEAPPELAGLDAVVLASSSAATALATAAGVAHGRAVVAAIGPETARSAHALGFQVGLVADAHTPAGLVEALAGRLARPSAGAASRSAAPQAGLQAPAAVPRAGASRARAAIASCDGSPA